MIRLIIGVACAVGLNCAWAPPLTAQSLPDWAAPSAPQAYDVPQDPPRQDAGPTLPGSPDQVPIDGGLGLLALAGGAYAARKLRQRG